MFGLKMRMGFTMSHESSWLFHIWNCKKTHMQFSLLSTEEGIGSRKESTEVFELWAWGKGDMGQLGCGDENSRKRPCLVTPVEVPKNACLSPMQGFPSVSQGIPSACHLGRLGTSLRSSESLHAGSKMEDLGGAYDWSSLDRRSQLPTFGLACGLFHSAMFIDGEVWMWGKGDGGRLGLGSEESIYKPTWNPYLRSIESIALGGLHSAAVTRQGELYTWGFGGFGALGHGVYQRELLPRKVEFFQGENVAYVSTGGAHTAVITASGELYTWGRDEGEGRLGHGERLITDEGVVSLPAKVESLPTSIVAVSCGGFFTTALTSEGQIWNWGANNNYELGRKDNISRLEPSPLPELENMHILHVASGGYHSAALTKDGKVFTWGHGGHGQLGHNSLANGRVPRLVEALSDLCVVYVACGSSWTAAVTDVGEIYCWGKNRDYQLGVPGLTDSQAVPVQLNIGEKNKQLQALGSAIAIAAGACHAICLIHSPED